ncbi:hypothetical protein GCM10027300_16610 [Modestobacter lapidis]
MTVTSCPSWASGTANMPLPPPTSSTRRGAPASITGESAAQIATVRAGGCAPVAGSVDGTRPSLVARCRVHRSAQRWRPGWGGPRRPVREGTE